MTDKIKFLRVFLRERDKNEKNSAGICGGCVWKAASG